MNNDIIFGIIGVAILYVLKPDLFSFLSRDNELDGGYEIDNVYIFNKAIILTASVYLPDGSVGKFMSLKPNCVGTYDLITDEFEVKNITLAENVNFKIGNLWEILCGRGKVYCNVCLSGEVVEGWMGIGTPQSKIIEDQIKNLRSQNADLRVRLEKTKGDLDEALMELSEMNRKVFKQKTKKDEEDNVEEVV